MTDIDVLLAAHDANEREGLGLTPVQIATVLEKYTHRGRPKSGRTVYRDSTGDQAAARADRKPRR